MDVLELARTLLAVESTSGREGRVAALVADRLEADGWRVIRQPVPGGDPDMAEPRVNVIATLDDAPPEVVLTTHLDTVPPYIAPSEDEEWLFGRGTCDAKGIFAAQWAAAERLRARGHRRVALVGVVGEETDSLGARLLPEALPKARWIVDGEPTEGVMSSAAKGVLSLELRARGQAGHSAYPERGRSAVHTLVTALARLLQAELPSDPAFGVSTVNVGRIEGGVAGNVIAPEARALVVVRVAGELDAVRAAVLAHLGDDVEHEILTASPGQRIHVPEGYAATPVAFGSDVPHLRAIGTPLLVGPGSIHDAHTSHERLRKADLLAAVDLYAEVAEALLGAGAAG